MSYDPRSGVFPGFVGGNGSGSTHGVMESERQEPSVVGKEEEERLRMKGAVRE